MRIASCLVDTNVLLRITRRSDPLHRAIDRALSVLTSQDAALYFTHQNVAELWNTVTRPTTSNGFGLSTADAEREVISIEGALTLLPDSEAVYREWRRIVARYAVTGVQVHDARLAAAMYVHGVGHILTLNVADFGRFVGLTPLHPNTI